MKKKKEKRRERRECIGTQGTRSRHPCNGAFHQRQETDGVREPRLQRSHQNQTVCSAEEKRLEELTQSNFAGLPFRVEVYNEKLKPIAAGRSNKTGRRLRVRMCIYPPWS